MIPSQPAPEGNKSVSVTPTKWTDDKGNDVTPIEQGDLGMTHPISFCPHVGQRLVVFALNGRVSLAPPKPGQTDNATVKNVSDVNMTGSVVTCHLELEIDQIGGKPPKKFKCESVVSSSAKHLEPPKKVLEIGTPVTVDTETSGIKEAEAGDNVIGYVLKQLDNDTVQISVGAGGAIVNIQQNNNVQPTHTVGSSTPIWPKLWPVGTKVQAIRNNYQEGFFNGDTGVVIERFLDPDGSLKRIVVEWDLPFHAKSKETFEIHADDMHDWFKEYVYPQPQPQPVFVPTPPAEPTPPPAPGPARAQRSIRL
jgi:hypothetical protein